MLARRTTSSQKRDLIGMKIDHPRKNRAIVCNLKKPQRMRVETQGSNIYKKRVLSGMNIITVINIYNKSERAQRATGAFNINVIHRLKEKLPKTSRR